MGTWGTDNFANDTAMDWVGDLAESSDLRVVRAALDEVMGTDGYVDADVGAVGLAAAEVVAALDGRAMDDLPDEVATWVATHRAQRDPALADLARAAIGRVTSEASRSELRELWDEAAPEDRDAWLAAADDLRARLG